MKTGNGPRVTHARLREILRYYKTTGHFVWRAPIFRNNNVGKIAGSRAKGYINISIDRRLYPANQLAWFYVTGKWSEHEIDHKNRKRDDNRWANLREATTAHNHENRTKSKDKLSQYIGVSWTPLAGGRWHAYVGCEIDGRKRHIYIGRFDTERDAARAYDAKVKELHLDWKTLNFGRGHRALT